MGDLLKSLLPTAATLLLGPGAGIAVKFLADKLGVPEQTAEAVTTAMTSLAESPEGRAKLAEIDAALKTHAQDIGLDLERLAASNAAEINATMRAEAGAEHWPTYSWRPAIGFAVALNLVLTALVVVIAYAGVILLGKDAAPLAYIAGMIGAMAALVGVAVPILGIASWFRGKAQADPTLPTINRG